jgi:DNA-binding MarR family transcriptional regulator
MPSTPHSNLMSRLGVAFLTWRRYLQKSLNPLGVTLKQQYVLRQLARSEPLYPSDIARMLFCDRPTATVVLDNLAKQGWIERSKDPANRKFTLITLTPAGRQKLDALAALQPEPFDPLACFSEEEIRQLSDLLAKLNRHLAPLNDLPESGDD